MYFLLAGDTFKRALHRYARNRRGSVALYFASVCALCAARCGGLRSTRSGQKKVQGWRKGAGSKIAVGPPIPIYYPGQKNRYSRNTHEIDPHYDHVISRDIDFDLQRELATRSYRESHRCRTEARYRTISHDRTVDQPHEFLGCNDFFGQGIYRE